jgi:ComEC/Rec2-related protein
MHVRHHFLSYFSFPATTWLFPCTLAFVLGITGQAHPSFLLLSIILLMSLCMFNVVIHDTRNNRTLISIVLFCIFYTAGACRWWHQRQSYTAQQSLINGATIDIRATTYEIHELAHPCFKQCVVLNLEAYRPSGTTTWKPLHGAFVLYTKQPMQHPYYTTLIVKYLTIKPPVAEDYQTYLIKEGILGTYFTTMVDAVVLKEASSWWGNIKTMRDNLRLSFKKELSSQTFSLFSTLFLGNRLSNAQEPEHQADLFKRWGISHHLARSGLHLLLVVMLFKRIFMYIPLGFFLKQLLLLMLVIVYICLSWASISLYRAFGMFFFYKFCEFLDLPLNIIHIISFVCLLTLLINPHQLLFLDFQLSFGFTFALAWLNYYQRYKKRFFFNYY